MRIDARRKRMASLALLIAGFAVLGVSAYRWYTGRPEYTRDLVIQALEHSDGAALWQLSERRETEWAELQPATIETLLRTAGWSGPHPGRHRLERAQQPVDFAIWSVYYSARADDRIVVPLINHPDGSWRLNITYLLMSVARREAAVRGKPGRGAYSAAAQAVGIEPRVNALRDLTREEPAPYISQRR
jgi:hypothetical protein